MEKKEIALPKMGAKRMKFRLNMSTTHFRIMQLYIFKQTRKIRR